MRAAITLALVIAFQGVHADDLDLIVDSAVSADVRGEAYGRLASAEFRAIAPKLATLIDTHRIFSGIGPRTKEPWSESQLSERDRLGFTLRQLWFHHLESAKTRGGHTPLMLELLEDSSLGGGRLLAIAGLSSRLDSGRAFSDPSLPSFDSILIRLDRLAADSQQPLDLRRHLITILFKHGDPNKYLASAIELSSAEGTPERQAEAFRFCTSTAQATKLTDANRKRYVRHCFQLLERIDDGRSGAGYFLALHIGRFFGVPPKRGGRESFAPDQGLAQYQDTHGLAKSFFQDTVVNARRWWNEHKHEY